MDDTKTTLSIPKWLSKDLEKIARLRTKEARRHVYKNEVLIDLVKGEIARLGW